MPTAAEITAERRRQFGNAVLTARKMCGFSQEHLAELVAAETGEALTQGSISYWESARSVPRDENLEGVERALRLQPGTLRDILHPPTQYIRPAGISRTQDSSDLDALASKSGIDPSSLDDDERNMLQVVFDGIRARRSER